MKKLAAFTVMAFLAIAVLPNAFAQQNGDVDCNEDINILDIVYLINYEYKGGPDPCEFAAEPGVSWVHYNSRSIDVGYSWSNLITLYFMAPDDGWASVNFSHVVYTSTYNLVYRLYDEIPDKVETDRVYSEISQYNTESPMSWTETFPVTTGLNIIYLDVRGIWRGDEEEEPTRTVINFNNVNMSANYFPEDYTVIPRK
ncbi:MAG: hypothetical protein GY865_06560 [candidate division Zixibacteria bacterium]|nr:hypothetical protein [candidate division Zixibacteria bacterium]